MNFQPICEDEESMEYQQEEESSEFTSINDDIIEVANSQNGSVDLAEGSILHQQSTNNAQSMNKKMIDTKMSKASRESKSMSHSTHEKRSNQLEENFIR